MPPPTYGHDGFIPTHALEYRMHDCMMNRNLGEENLVGKKFGGNKVKWNCREEHLADAKKY